MEKTNFKFDRLFDYEIPSNLVSEVHLGSFVCVPFGRGNSLRQAVVFNIELRKSISENIKSVSFVLPEELFVSRHVLELIEYLHSSCFCSWFEAARAVLPSGFFYRFEINWKFKCCCEKTQSVETLQYVNWFKQFCGGCCDGENVTSAVKLAFKSGKVDPIDYLEKNGFLIRSVYIKRRVKNKTIAGVRVCSSADNFEKITVKQKVALDYIKKFDCVAVKEVCYFCGITQSVIKNLVAKQMVKIVEIPKYRNPYEKICKTCYVEDIVLTKEQNRVFFQIVNFLKMKKAGVSLLRGITGSGKTQIFLKLIDYVLKNGRQCILLVPEILLSTQILNFFQSFFGNDIAVINSALSNGERLDEYRRIANGEANLVIGTRSAIFAPCKDIGLIIMDEEGDGSYKSCDMSPRYNARDVAKFRCFKFGAGLILASATPSIETAYFSKIGKYSEFVLTKRYNNFSLPKVSIVDLKKSKKSIISEVSMELYLEIEKNLKLKEQTILLLNRRGYSTSAVCVECGWTARCVNCSSVMTYHSLNNLLICHYCGFFCKKIVTCRDCGGNHILYFGVGTQKIEEEITNAFPFAKVLRLDADSAHTRVEMEENIKNFEVGKYDILVGTQIVAKGLNFPNVTLVGVLTADSMLYGADFRCNERLFSLLTQVVGRSGRYNKLGRAIIQTHNPENRTILQAAKQDYEKFYEDEIIERKTFFCPPFCDLCIITFSCIYERLVVECSKLFVKTCKYMADGSIALNLLGISTPYLEMLNKNHRRRIIIKCRNGIKFRSWIKEVVVEVFSRGKFVDVKLNIDINGEII